MVDGFSMAQAYNEHFGRQLDVKNVLLRMFGTLPLSISLAAAILAVAVAPTEVHA